MEDPINPTKAPKGVSEDEIREKVRAGLTRDQAIEVILRQRDHDEDLEERAAQEAKAKAAKAKADAEAAKLAAKAAGANPPSKPDGKAPEGDKKKDADAK